MKGEEAARCFYGGGNFARSGAMPPTTQRLLQDKGSVQALDGAPHAHRKSLFMAMMSTPSIESAADRLGGHWQDLARVQHAPFSLHGAMQRLLCRTVCEWAGLDLSAHDLEQRTVEMSAMIDSAGTFSPGVVRAMMLRRRAERWAKHVVSQERLKGTAPSGSPLARIAAHMDEGGHPLPLEVAAVELLNVIRPTVAVARFVTFAAMALEKRPDWRERLATFDMSDMCCFAQEVRRYYPFFPVVGGRARERISWNGHCFEQGDWAILGLHATNHDPDLWDAPHHFEPERFRDYDSTGFDFVPQGAGLYHDDHRCPGEPLTVSLVGRMAAELASSEYDVPEQDLTIPQNRFPTIPRSGFVMAFRH